MTDVGLLVALAAGVLSLLSPCSALLLPSFFAYAFATRTALLGRTLAFYGGLLITLVPLGIGASAASTLFYGHRSTLITVAGWTIVVLGLVQIFGGGFAVPFSARLQQRAGRFTRGAGWTSTVALGAVYGLAGFCSGPVLGAILTVAATRPSPLDGGVLLAVYAFGMAAPLFLLALLWDRFRLGQKRWLRGRSFEVGALTLHTTSVISGLLFVVVGALFLRYDGTAGLLGAAGLGDTTDLEWAAQQWVSQYLGGIPAWSIAAAVAVVAALYAWRGGRRRPASARDDEERAEERAKMSGRTETADSRPTRTRA